MFNLFSLKGGISTVQGFFCDGVNVGMKTNPANSGDSDIDEGSNIGAGVIICNYDGKEKHQTTIGKNVFVGSDSQLVAPVTIEDDVMIAAGSTITRDVPSGALAISRTPTKQIKNFFYKFFSGGK